MNKEDFKRFGLWTVTTEGDCEGRTTRQLGTHEGDIDEIALALADRCYYKLTFEPINPKKLDRAPKKHEVHIEVDGLSQHALEILLNREQLGELRVEKGQFYNSVKLTKTLKENPEQAMIRKLKEAGFNPREVINTFKQR